MADEALTGKSTAHIETSVVVRVALPVPLDTLFDYTANLAADEPPIARGVRVRVSFAGRQLIGIVMDTGSSSGHPGKLKPVSEVLDEAPLMDPAVLDLLEWAATYYHHPIGEALALALPPGLRRGSGVQSRLIEAWAVQASFDAGQLSRAPRQSAAFTSIASRSEPMTSAEAAELGIGRATLKALADRNAIQRKSIPQATLPPIRADFELPELTAEQQHAVAELHSQTGFGVALLDGITGSGKTEVYLRAIADRIGNGGQALVLVPEIGLTPQTTARFSERFSNVVTYHSGMAAGERARAWHTAAAGTSGVVIGTRSAAFMPLPKLALIIVDEEHDGSFKQQDGLRYSARDLLVKRAQAAEVPIVLGSATPSLETLHRARSNDWSHLRLTHRPGQAAPPRAQLIDLRGINPTEGLSADLLHAIRGELESDNQVLVYLNRRGFAPVLHCRHCGWIAECDHCSVRMTVHRRPPVMRCHHCDNRTPVPSACPECGADSPEPIGAGTQRLEDALQAQLEGFPVLRIDRDSTRSMRAMQEVLTRVGSGEPLALLGTQMLAKGHHFPNVTLVAVVNIDGGLFSADYRGAERMVQSVIQVSGRAGRADRPGRVLFQTWHPDHPLIEHLLSADYGAFATATLAERQMAGLPPFARLALLRAEAADSRTAEQVLADCAHLQRPDNVDAFGPVPAPLERVMGMHRHQLLLRSSDRRALHHAVSIFVQHLRNSAARSVRWSVDMDPQDLL